MCSLVLEDFSHAPFVAPLIYQRRRRNARAESSAACTSAGRLSEAAAAAAENVVSALVFPAPTDDSNANVDEDEGDNE